MVAAPSREGPGEGPFFPFRNVRKHQAPLRHETEAPQLSGGGPPSCMDVPPSLVVHVEYRLGQGDEAVRIKGVAPVPQLLRIDGPEVPVGLNGVLAASVQTSGESDVLVEGLDECAVPPAQLERGRPGWEKKLRVRGKACNLRRRARGENTTYRPRGVRMEGAHEAGMVMWAHVKVVERIQQATCPIRRPFLVRDIGVVRVFV